MSDGIMEIGITAQEFDRHLRSIEDCQNGTLLTMETDIRLFEGIEAILRDLPVCGEDNMRAFWFPLPRGTFEQYVSEEYDEDDEEDIEEARGWYDYRYPDEYKWYVLRYTYTEEYGRYISIDGNYMFIAENREYCRRYWDHEGLLSSLIGICRRMAGQIEDGSYPDIVREQLPLRYRMGVVRRRDLWEGGYISREEDLEGLTNREVEDFERLIGMGLSETPEGRFRDMTVNRYLELCSICFAAQGCDLEGKDLEERYRRFADGRDSGMLDLDRDDPVAFREFVKTSHDGHVWEVRPGHGYSRMHLYPHNDEGGYYLSVSGNFDRAAFVRTALGIHETGLPLQIYEGEKVLRAIHGEDWLGIVPEGNFPFYKNHLFKDHDVIDCMSYSDELIGKVGDRITWYPVNTFYE